MVTGKDIFKIGLLLQSSNEIGNNVLPRRELLINLPETSESTKGNKEKLENACIYQQIIYTLTRMIRQGKKTEFLICVGPKTHDNVSLQICVIG